LKSGLNFSEASADADVMLCQWHSDAARFTRSDAMFAKINQRSENFTLRSNISPTCKGGFS